LSQYFILVSNTRIQIFLKNLIKCSALLRILVFSAFIRNECDIGTSVPGKNLRRTIIDVTKIIFNTDADEVIISGIDLDSMLFFHSLNK